MTTTNDTSAAQARSFTVPEALFTETMAHIATVPGWCGPEKARRILRTVAGECPDVAVEIGVFGGSSLIPQIIGARENRTTTIYGIDPWRTDAALDEMIEDANRAYWSMVDLDAIYDIARDMVERLGARRSCRLIRAKAEDVVNFFDEASVGLLHVDGNHSDEKSCRDVELYLPKVRRGGIVIFDDLSWTEGGQRTTARAIGLVEAACDRVEVVEDCAFFRKR